MKLGIGAKAGLASGIILTMVYALGSVSDYLLVYHAKLISSEFFAGKTILKLFLAPVEFMVLFIALASTFLGWYIYRAFVSTDITFLALIFVGYTTLAGVFEKIYFLFSAKTTIKKSIIYSIGVWFILGVLAFLLILIVPVINIQLDIKLEDFVIHIFNIVGWLLYGFLLGKFYDAFSKEPDAGIFYMIKKMLLRKSQ